MVSWTSGLCRNGLLKTKASQLEFVDERINDANRIALVNVVIDTLGK